MSTDCIKIQFSRIQGHENPALLKVIIACILFADKKQNLENVGLNR